ILPLYSCLLIKPPCFLSDKLLGATLYFCLTGHNPRNNKPTVFNFASVRDFNVQVPINLDNLILNLVATDEKKRPMDAMGVLRHLNDIQLTAGNTTFDINGNANAMGSYYDARRAKQALIQLQARMMLNHLPILARRGW